MSFKITITYNDGTTPEPRIFNDPSNCKCPTSRFLRDLVKESKFKTIIIENGEFN
jgi:hypothetical protein